ncbi:MAG TPA: FkbM family methyltransferase [Candidatus Udaeobacter sp.]|nr:FkbM family methyltransferase [Candidatus Udaeobacter sp.]
MSGSTSLASRAAGRLGRYGWLHRLIGAVRIYQLAGAILRRRPIVRRLRGGRLVYRISSPDQFGIEGELFGQQIYAPALAGGSITAYVDLGCNAGWFAVWLAAEAPDVERVGLLFDADQHMVDEALWHLRANRLKNQDVVYGAVGLPLGTPNAVFHIHPSSAASTLLDYEREKGGQPPAKGTVRTVTVPAVSISEEWRKRFGDRQVDMVKMNIEGSELDVIRYEHEFFAAQVRSVILQWHKWHVRLEELDAALRTSGFVHRQTYGETAWYGTALYSRAPIQADAGG